MHVRQGQTLVLLKGLQCLAGRCEFGSSMFKLSLEIQRKRTLPVKQSTCRRCTQTQCVPCCHQHTNCPVKLLIVALQCTPYTQSPHSTLQSVMNNMREEGIKNLWCFSKTKKEKLQPEFTWIDWSFSVFPVLYCSLYFLEPKHRYGAGTQKHKDKPLLSLHGGRQGGLQMEEKKKSPEKPQ